MMKITMPKSVNKMLFQVKKHSPEILIAAGTIGTVASAVLACKATLKVNDILEETKETVDVIHQTAESEEFGDKYTPEDQKKDLAIVYANTGIKIAKLYAPAVGLGIVSLASILTSHKIMRTRNIALGAAYAGVAQSFKDYRGRVIDRFGQEVDRELKYGIKAQKITETEVDPETGKEKKVKKVVDVIEGVEGYSDYARFFDEASPAWEKNSEMNLYFLRAQQEYANNLLVAKGHLFLNEVYDMLGIPRTKAGQIVGWVYDKKNPVGDNYVDFGIYDIHRESNRDFVNGYERSILLDFNVDGPILNLI